MGNETQMITQPNLDQDWMIYPLFDLSFGVIHSLDEESRYALYKTSGDFYE